MPPYHLRRAGIWRQEHLSPTYDANGNLTKDADYAYTYDAWNNLVKVTAQNDISVTVGQYAFFGDGRRAKKVVSNRGDLNATTYFLYDGDRLIEERDGSEGVVHQHVYGTQVPVVQAHIPELLMTSGKNGTYFVYQDANWNVIGLTTPDSLLAEEYNYTPYGRMIAKRHTAFGDSDGDGDVDATDNTAWLATQGGGGTYDRTFDADYDGDNDFYDETAFNANYLAAGTSVEVSGRLWSPNGNRWTFTAREHDVETGLMHDWPRGYLPLFLICGSTAFALSAVRTRSRPIGQLSRVRFGCGLAQNRPIRDRDATLRRGTIRKRDRTEFGTYGSRALPRNARLRGAPLVVSRPEADRRLASEAASFSRLIP